VPVPLDPVVERNRELLLKRSQVGIAKYGVTLASAGLGRRAILQHALEEALDLANYLQTEIMRLDGERTNCDVRLRTTKGPNMIRKFLERLFKGTPPELPMHDKFVSWYRSPRIGAPVEYLADAPDGEGYIYVRKIEDAKRFDSEQDARQPTPVYDGSANIEARSGVYRVRR
jgi:hypothetical protein